MKFLVFGFIALLLSALVMSCGDEQNEFLRPSVADKVTAETVEEVDAGKVNADKVTAETVEEVDAGKVNADKVTAETVEEVDAGKVNADKIFAEEVVIVPSAKPVPDWAYRIAEPTVLNGIPALFAIQGFSVVYETQDFKNFTVVTVTRDVPSVGRVIVCPFTFVYHFMEPFWNSYISCEGPGTITVNQNTGAVTTQEGLMYIGHSESFQE